MYISGIASRHRKFGRESPIAQTHFQLFLFLCVDIEYKPKLYEIKSNLLHLMKICGLSTERKEILLQ